MRYRVHFARSNSREKSWVIQGDSGASLTVREVKLYSPVYFPPSSPHSVPEAWAEVEGTLKIENGKAIIE